MLGKTSENKKNVEKNNVPSCPFDISESSKTNISKNSLNVTFPEATVASLDPLLLPYGHLNLAQVVGDLE